MKVILTMRSSEQPMTFSGEGGVFTAAVAELSSLGVLATRLLASPATGREI